MITVTHRVLTLKHTMKSFVVLFVVVAVVAVNAVPVEKDVKIPKQDATTLRKDAEVQPQNNAGTKVQEPGNVKNEGQGENLPVTPATKPCYRVTVTKHIKEPEKLVQVMKESKA